MRDKLPPDFDADWYAATYPDVALSSLNPREHYRRFGRILGRPPKGSASPRPVELASAEEVARHMDSPSAKRETPPAPSQQPVEQEPVKSSPIIDRPKDFDPTATLPKAAPPKPGGGPGGVFSLEALSKIDAATDESRSAIRPALQAYAKLLNIEAPSGLNEAAATVSCGATPFQAESTRIENAWFVDGSRLRLALAGGTEGAAQSDARVLRAYQANPASPAELHLLGSGVMLPALGPVFHDLELLHPLMPLLLELSDADGAARAFALLPFPSLLPGGVHGAELRALQVEPKPMDSFWALSEAMLREAVGDDGSPDRSVVGVSVGADQGANDGLLLTALFQEWLAAVFGVAVEPTGHASAGAPRRQGKSRTSKTGLQLVLPPGFLPTISALVSRRLPPADGAAMNGSYLVAEPDSYRPRWSIALPGDQDFGSAVPLLKAPSKADAPSVAPIEIAPVPLAIALRSRSALPIPGSGVAVGDAVPLAADRGTLSVLVDASDGSRVSRLIQTIRRAVGGELEFIVCIAGTDSEIRAALDRTCGGEGWREAPEGAGLPEIARGLRGETLLTVSDRIELDDGRQLLALLELLERRETASSVACALLAETIIKKEVVLQPASGGLFPTGVSFVSGPHLSFGEIDVLQALPDLTYPVVANTRHLTVWRRRALAELSEGRGAASAAAEDARIGLDLTRAGYRNWCTTQVRARLLGPYVARDMIDPVGGGYLPPDRWHDILSRVTVGRELF
jgi:hypothetical protein